VASFENRSGFAGQWEIGTGMADLLVSELIASQHVVVVERGQLDKVVDEIRRQRQRLFRPEGRVNEGRLRNAQYLIRGVINDFSQVGGGSLALWFRRLLTLGAGGYRARVALTLTVIDVESGEIEGSVSSAATASAGEAYVGAEYKGIAFGGDAFFKTPLGVATRKAIHRGVNALLKTIPKESWEPMIAEVLGDRIVLNGGINRGFVVGAVYEVRHAGRPITDPATGEVLSLLPGPVVGKLRVTDVHRDISYAEAIEGAGFQRGQRLIRIPTRHNQ